MVAAPPSLVGRRGSSAAVAGGAPPAGRCEISSLSPMGGAAEESPLVEVEVTSSSASRGLTQRVEVAAMPGRIVVAEQSGEALGG